MDPERNNRPGPAGGEGAHAGLLERPLTPRSLVASFLLGTRPPRVRGAHLVRFCSRFGIAEGTTRTALHRMVERGELVARDGAYELAGRVRARQEPQEWSIAPELREPWDGAWRLAVVAADARDAADRRALRGAMRALRMAELHEGTWARPDNLPAEAAPAEAAATVAAQCATWRGEPDGDAAALAAGLFRPQRWAERAAELVARGRDSIRALRRGDVDRLAEAFYVGAATLTHLRADPLLPAALLPADWPGPALREGYREYRDAYGVAVAAWLRDADASSRANL